MQSFLYSAKNRAGQTVTDRVSASNLADARMVLEQEGLTEITFHTDEFTEKQLAILRYQMSDEPAPEVSPDLEKEGRQLGGIWSTIWYGIKLQWGWWLFFALWNTVSWLKGPPFGWLGWSGFIITGLFVLAFVIFRVPAIAFDNLLQAAVWHRGDGVRRWVGVLRTFRRFTGIGVPEMELDCRMAVTMAREGDLPGAIALFRKHETDATGKAYYFSRQANVFDSARDYRGALECQYKAVQEAGAESLNFRLDYALMLARRMRDADAVDLILKDIPEANLPDLAKAFVSWIRGMIALERRQFVDAEKHFRASLQHNEAYHKSPLVHGMRIEVKAFLSISLGHQGRIAEAKDLLKGCVSLLNARKETELLDRCRASVSSN